MYKVEYPSKSKGATLTLLYFRRTHDLFDSTEPPQRCASVRMSCFLFLDNQLRQNARLSVPTTYVESLSAGAGEPTNRCCGRSPDRATTRDRRSPLPFDLSRTQNAKRRPAVGPRAGSGDPRTTGSGDPRTTLRPAHNSDAPAPATPPTPPLPRQRTVSDRVVVSGSRVPWPRKSRGTSPD